VGADVDRIPNYRPAMHCNLTSTIAEPGSTAGIGGPLRIMACHYSREGAEIACVGWVANQLGPGNNLALRLACVRNPELANVRTVGPQHATFDDTLPRGR
jgi:hypothetical protein